MQFSIALTTVVTALAQFVTAADPQTGWKPDYCPSALLCSPRVLHQADNTIAGLTESAPTNSTTIPRKFGFLLFQSFDMLDVFRTLEVLYQVSWQYQIELHLIAETMDPVTVKPSSAAMNKMNSSWSPEVLLTDTLETAPRDLDVLLVPGGIGVRSPYLNASVDFIAEMEPNLQYLMTVCTGAILASNAGVLDGRRATTNKNSWDSITSANDKVDWIGPARWVVDGNLWTTSGVSAGMDGMLGFVECVYGPDVATTVAKYVSPFRLQSDLR